MLVYSFFGITLLALVALSSAATTDSAEDDDGILDQAGFNKFRTFQSKFKRQCENGTTICKQRKRNFAANSQWMDRWRSGHKDQKYQLGMTQYMDWSKAEMKKMIMSLSNMPPKKPIASLQTEDNTRSKRATPTSFDWRTRFVVNPIKNQGSCGSCWAFAAVAAIEIQANWGNKRFNSSRRTWSEQYLMDCSQPGDGCQGGWPESAISWVQSNGLATSDQVPYAEQSKKCPDITVNRPVIGWKDFTGKPGPALTYVQNTGPITAAFFVCNDFYYYTGGVYTYNCTPDDPNFLGGHAVTIIGFGSFRFDLFYGGTTADGVDYWLARNQWGTNWGIGGYFMIERNTDIASFESWGLTAPRTTLVI